MSDFQSLTTQSMFVHFPAAEVAYRRERIAADFAAAASRPHRVRTALRRARGERTGDSDAVA